MGCYSGTLDAFGVYIHRRTCQRFLSSTTTIQDDGDDFYGSYSTYFDGASYRTWAMLTCPGSTHHLLRDNLRISDWICCLCLVKVDTLSSIAFVYLAFLAFDSDVFVHAQQELALQPDG